MEDSIGAVIVEDRRREDNLSRRERYHCYSLDAAQFEGAEYSGGETPETQMERGLDAERIKRIRLAQTCRLETTYKIDI